MMVQRTERERFKHRSIVFALDGLGSHFRRLKPVAGASFAVEDCGVELLFGGKMAEDHRFRDAGCVGNFLGGGAAKASFGKESHGNPEDLLPALLTGHPGAACHALNRHLSAQTPDPPTSK